MTTTQNTPTQNASAQPSAMPSNNRIRQAMILAAGKGTRMRPLTLDTPKPLVEVGGQPLIVWHINALKSAGIDNITINTSWLSDKLMDYLGDGGEYGVTIRWSVEEDDPLETAGGIAKALHDGKLDNEPFILVNGDVWCDVDFEPLTRMSLEDGKLAHLFLVDNPEHHPKGDFAIQNGLATDKPVLDTDEKLTFSGISVMSPELVKEVLAGQPAPLAPLFAKGMMKFKISASHLSEQTANGQESIQWVDVGTPERLDAINDAIANGADAHHQGRV